MSGGGSTQSQSKSETKDVWAPAQPYITDILGKAQGLYNSGAGTQTWGGPVNAGFNPQQWDALTATQNMANQNQGRYNPVVGNATGMAGGNGLTAAYDQPMNTFRDVASGAALPTAAQTYLTGMAGSDGSTNPWLTKMLDANASRIGNRVSSAMSGAGRYGSFGHGDAMARSINESNLPLLSQAYEADQGRKIQAAGLIDQSRRAADATQLAGATGQTGILNFGQQNAQGWAGMLPALNNLQYDASNRSLGIGGMMQAQNQAQIDAERARFEQNQNIPWTSLGKYAGVFGNIAPSFANAGTTTGTATGKTEKQPGFLDYMELFRGNNGSPAGNAASAVLGFLGL